MSLARQIPDAAKVHQIAAADPERSVFVSANAGSGKTHVLVQRVINLLLRGEDPAKILCITFTKAAAANMATRVFNTLAEWTALDDDALDEKIKLATGKAPDTPRRAIARRLFANALETPGGLKVQTIHAFCTRLLHQFPFEADVAARFEVLDEAATSQLLNELTLEVLLEGATRPDGELGKALATAITAAADITFKEVIAETIGKRDLITEWIARAGGVQQAIDELSGTFGLAPGDSMAAVETEYFSGSLIPQSEWPALIDFLATSDRPTDRELGGFLAAARAATGRDSIEQYQRLFCTKTLERRKNVLTSNFAKANPGWNSRLIAEQDRVCRLIAREFALRARDRSAALITVAAAVIGRYRAEKDRRGLLDYEDLIDKALTLLLDASTKSTAAAWVLYKLDLGINHVLVDEAQDTSDKQWEIIKILVAEFLPGGARDNVRRTLFAVGDEKQSIFSFQGAVPHKFAKMRDHFHALHETSDVAFAVERLDFSFRSAIGVLNAVDLVFKQPAAFRGLTADPTWTVHQALPDAVPGEVEIWELTGPDEKDAGKEGWDAPFDTTSETSPSVKLATRIARTVRGWIAKGTRPREVLILVRQRGPMFEAVIRALKQAQIEVAGADRLVLTEHIAIMDLLVLGDALLLPDDDLALATILKSPLFDFDDEKLYKLAYHRKGPLRSMLRAKAGEDVAFGAASSALDALERAARNLSPFAFYAHVLGSRKGRAQILARLGVEASDPLDEFLDLALSYEQRETPSLQGFLNWIRAAQSEVKRDMEMARDEVRVMTVHGAKGLESKNVILIDHTTTRPEGAHPPRLLTVPITNAPPDATALIWGVAKDKDAGPMANARAQAVEAARDEYRRLLYVGLTRAEERLIVCGAKGVNKAPEGCWHDLVLTALQPLSDEDRDTDGKIWRFHKGAPTEPDEGTPTPKQQVSLPPWLTVNAPPSPPATVILRPSGTDDDEPRHVGDGSGREAARLRGTLTHRLLQSLPDIPAARREKVAVEFLARRGHELSADQRAALLREVLLLIEHKDFAPLFAPGSRAEVSIGGRVAAADGTMSLVSGQVDRLAVTQDAILIADFKTNRPAPRRIEAVPRGYISQLALYRAVLKKLYPDRKVRAVLLWTEVPDLMELSPDILDEAFSRVTSP
ncbi:MAG TPA: double-strand break repair helicase AddA [Pseudolabrys sp.]|nr:double-strand break repair helicase AddA [Pseudolabrys sp.]